MKILTLISFLISIPVIFANISTNSFLSCAAGINTVDISLNYTEPNSIIPFWQVKDYVIFYLYTKEQPGGKEMKINEGSLKFSGFNTKRPTNIVTHGYWSDSVSSCCTKVRDAFLQNGDSNVIVVDWWGMISIKRKVPLPYSTACKYVPMVANYVTEMINFLASHGMDLKTTTLIGYSLGAHLMGIASSKASKKVNYIVGLDPALPGYQSESSSDRLSANDATTVHVLHTNEGDCGLHGPMGHYDFYANGGNAQPGCWMNSCAHSRSYEYYAESISSYGSFNARRCVDVGAARKGNCDGHVVKMNEDVRKQSAPEGVYYFGTREKPPYSLK